MATGTIAGGTPAGRVVPPGSFGFDPGRRPPRRDLPTARRLLEEAGYPSGFEVDLDVGPNSRRAARALADQAAEAGNPLRLALPRPDEVRAAVVTPGRAVVLAPWAIRDADFVETRFCVRDAAMSMRSVV